MREIDYPDPPKGATMFGFRRINATTYLNFDTIISAKIVTEHVVRLEYIGGTNEMLYGEDAKKVIGFLHSESAFKEPHG